MDLVSVVIPAFNSEAYLGAAISSVLGQEDVPVECIVVDDGSTDRTPDVAASHPKSRYVRQPNQGVSAARNRGIGEASGRFIAFLDSDDVWLPRKLACQMELFSNEPRLALAYCGMHETDAQLQRSLERPAPSAHIAVRNSLLMEPPMVSLSQTGVVARWVFDEVGYFDEELSTSADTDMVLRIARRYKIAPVHESLALYRTHPEQMSGSAEAMQHDMKIVLERFFSSPDLPPDLRQLRRRAYSNLWLAVGGSRLRSDHYLAGARDLARAFLINPAHAARVIAGGLRKRWDESGWHGG